MKFTKHVDATLNPIFQHNANNAYNNRIFRIRDTGVIYRFQDVVTKARDDDDNRATSLYVHGSGESFSGPSLRADDLFVPCGNR